MSKQRWSSHFNFIMATGGAAVGLGSIWKFPYMAGTNGGGAFVILFMLALFVIGVPIVMGEMAVGKLGRANPVTSLRTLAKSSHANPHWRFLGWWGAVTLILILAFYSLIAGWSIAYLYKIWTGQLHGLGAYAIWRVWNDFFYDPIQLLFWHSIFMFLTLYVVAKGIHKGIERASRIMMPGLFIILLILSLYSSMFGDLKSALNFLFMADFSKVSPQVLLNALGQAAFVLAVGAGTMLTYGAYVPDRTNMAKAAIIIACMLVLVSGLSGIAIFPLVFSYNLPVESGPSLMFTVLPIAFNNMPLGTFLGGLFFLCLWFAAWTSSISMAEPLVLILNEEYRMPRRSGSILIGLIAWALGGVLLLSFDMLFTIIANTSTNIMLPLGALGYAIFAGWLLDKKQAAQGLGLDSKRLFKGWRFLIRYIAPLGIICVLAMELFRLIKL